MNTPSLVRLSAAATVLGGACLALFPLTHPWGELAGAHAGTRATWMLAHGFHFFAGLFLLLGLPGLGVLHLPRAARLGTAAFAIAYVGTALFTGTGMFTGFIWPILAHHAPALVEVDGPFFSPPHPLIGITSVLFSVGYILLAVELTRRGSLAVGPMAALVAGAVLFILPPEPITPAPWIGFVLGGLLFGGGLVALGLGARWPDPGPASRAAPELSLHSPTARGAEIDR